MEGDCVDKIYYVKEGQITITEIKPVAKLAAKNKRNVDITD